MSYKMIIDTETSGLPMTKGFCQFYNPQYTKYYEGSRMIELGYIICDNEGNIIKQYNNLVIPNGYEITNTHIHGITNEDALKGLQLIDVLNDLKTDLANVDTIIAHNAQFDINIILSECYRLKHKDLITLVKNKNIVCTMQKGKLFMDRMKFPKLIELYKFIFKREFKQEHRALSDATACMECYFQMVSV